MDEKKAELEHRFKNLKEKINISKLKDKLVELEKKTYEEGFWNEHEKASEISKEIVDLKDTIENVEMMELYLDENELNELEKLLNEYEIELYFSGDYDSRPVLLSIHAGQGGTEAMDWTSMLYRMYTRFCEKNNYKWEMIDIVEGEEAGIKSITLSIKGKRAYGYLKAEAGVHRLVRLSPFNANALRQTSFALVEVIPVIDEDIDIEIKDEDIEFEAFRSGGHGGQNVNKAS